ncbi:leucine dehydrogenase [Amycolatopsis bartoniae]|uniref:Leucine dehydrogenase n=1 Tax=Amycolatopsis bartoniae TaxID=941986 RepID=A0A8H9IT84_9PSEU|nr:Glu/Leu/Phe/Val dehydrogenase dimerization domain-containing protein [Amycolatopsis bartoniae]MBB2934335.1 leucine dehydrogenase [Amycolatopsis bartoniae]TVT00186.1 Glu/Leu/Phe/Val dehydrogenase [Amycolatopsis bartoniae]GHF48100.1 leucine dehydrogenase [Amycolatopsis bartoniae]
MEHEDLTVRRGRRSGLPVIIAVHSRALGPAVGGVRLRRYSSWRDGVDDALRLSEAMTAKCAAAGLAFGGGKSVIALDEDTPLTPSLRQAALDDLGELIAAHDGSYLAGPDVGTGPADMLVLRQHSPHVFCLPEENGGTGTSSIPTAVGVLAALRAGVRHVFGADSVARLTVVISGLGSVGSLIAQGLPGARVVVSDVDSSRRDPAYEWVSPAEALRTPADIFVPAAVGGVFSPETVANVQARLVVGPANNQLTAYLVAGLLAERGVTWIPDFVASAGGVIYTLGREVEHLTHEEAMARVEGIGSTVDSLLGSARTPLDAAMDLVRERLTRPRADLASR